jgi:beta-glucosidase
MFTGTYNGKPFSKLVQSHLICLTNKLHFNKDNLRHVLMTSVESPTVAATWNNNIQL